MHSTEIRIAELLLESRDTAGISEEHRNELNDLLRASEQNREFAAQFLLDGDSLAELLATDEIADIAARRTRDVPERSPRIRLVAWIAAATVLIVAGLSAWVITSKSDSPIAMIADEANAVFSSGTVLPDGRLESGRYSLGSGIVAIEFRNGVSMTVRGPAEFEIVDEFRVKLSRGQARAFAPEGGRGFTIETPDADVVDLGTEFGILVEPGTGESRVQVFDGRVDVRNLHSKKTIASLQIGESAWIHPDGVESVNAPKFGVFPTPADLGYARWQQHDREVRGDRDVVLYHAFNRLPEHDRTLFDEADHPESIHGTITGARWVTGRWPEKRALLFDRPGDAVEIDIPGELPQFTISLWVNIDRFDHALTPIFNSAGWEEGDFHLQFSRSRGTIFAAVFPETLKSTSTAEVRVGRWIHLAAVVDTENGFASTWVDGRLAVRSALSDDAVSRPGFCRLGAWHSEDKTRRGRDREFRGRIDELILWRRVLNEDEIHRLFTKGRPGRLPRE